MSELRLFVRVDGETREYRMPADTNIGMAQVRVCEELTAEGVVWDSPVLALVPPVERELEDQAA